MKATHARILRGTVATFAIAFAFAAAIALDGCSKSETTAVQPVALTRDTVCSLDGMTLTDYPGPKAQIHYDRGNPDFFCDTIEMFSTEGKHRADHLAEVPQGGLELLGHLGRGAFLWREDGTDCESCSRASTLPPTTTTPRDRARSASASCSAVRRTPRPSPVAKR